jgi:hypothetical protein
MYLFSAVAFAITFSQLSMPGNACLLLLSTWASQFEIPINSEKSVKIYIFTGQK